ncbi:MAG: hypothetical protein AAGB48_11475 [Planctomycetota bacterium]
MRGIWRGLGCLLGSLAVVSGCGSPQQRPVERDGVVAVRSPDAKRELRMSPEALRERYADGEARSALRDEALAVLSDATRSGDPQMRANAYEALELAPSTLRAAAPVGLLDDNLGVRAIAAVAVGRAKVTGQEELLRGLLVDESAFVRASADFALRALGADSGVDELEAALIQTESAGVRGHAVFLVGELGSAALLPALKDSAGRTINRASPAERRVVELQISEAMVKLGDEQQLSPIRAALYPSSPSDLEATALAVQMVGELSDRAMRGRLAQLSDLRGPTGEPLPPEIQLAIAISMAKLGDLSGWFVADQAWESDRFVLRADAAAVYGLTRRAQDLPKLRLLMRDRVGLVRVAAAGAVLRALDG